MLKVKDDNHKRLYDFESTKEGAIKLQKRSEKMKFSLMSDTMLKAMFQNSNRLKYSAKLISYYIDISYDVLLNNMELDKNELDKAKEDSKGERADYIAKIGSTSINIEVNNNKDEKYLERNMEFADRIYSEKIKAGKDYDYVQVIQINLNNFSFKGIDDVVEVYGIQNDNGIRLSNKKIYIQIYIPNLMRKWYDKGTKKLTECEKYLIALVEQDLEKLEEFGKENDIMSEYIEEAKDVSSEKELWKSYDHEQADKEAYISEGIEEGIKQGALSKSREIAKLLLEDNIDIKKISIYTGLSIEELIMMQN